MFLGKVSVLTSSINARYAFFSPVNSVLPTGGSFLGIRGRMDPAFIRKSFRSLAPVSFQMVKNNALHPSTANKLP